jgi:hypothetical protein
MVTLGAGMPIGSVRIRSIPQDEGNRNDSNEMLSDAQHPALSAGVGCPRKATLNRSQLERQSRLARCRKVLQDGHRQLAIADGGRVPAVPDEGRKGPDCLSGGRSHRNAILIASDC